MTTDKNVDAASSDHPVAATVDEPQGEQFAAQRTEGNKKEHQRPTHQGEALAEYKYREDLAPKPTHIIPADHVSVSYVPEGDPHPAGGFVEVTADQGAVVKTTSEVDEDRAKFAKEAKKARDADEAEARKAAKAENARTKS